MTKKKLEQDVENAYALLHRMKSGLRSKDARARARAREFFRKSDRFDREIAVALGEKSR